MASTPAASAEQRDWAELLRDVLSEVFRRLGAFDVLFPAQWVCRAWHRHSLDPSLWRVVDIRFHSDLSNVMDIEKVARDAVDRAAGRLDAYYGEYCGSDELLRYIADRTNTLRCLCLISCYNVSDKGLTDFVSRSPLLEELEITFSSLSEEVIESVGQLCPQLKRLRLNTQWYSSKFRHGLGIDSEPEIDHDVEALGIANTMHELRQLQLVGNGLTNKGLLAILDNCPNLESIDIRCCYNVKVDDSTGSKLTRIKYVRLPTDSTSDYGFVAEAEEFDEDTDLNLSDLSEIDMMYDDVNDDYYDVSDGDYNDYDGFFLP